MLGGYGWLEASKQYFVVDMPRLEGGIIRNPISIKYCKTRTTPRILPSKVGVIPETNIYDQPARGMDAVGQECNSRA